MDHWYDDHDNLACFVRWALGDDPAFDVVYFLEKPWKWTPEWRMVEARINEDKGLNREVDASFYQPDTALLTSDEIEVERRLAMAAIGGAA